MNGSARSFGAITIANALPMGVGCAVGVALSVDASVTLTIHGSRRSPKLEIPPGCQTPLVEESLRAGLARYYPEPGVVARVSVRSEIPVARGLKSSSAVSSAILLAIARAAGKEPSALEIGRGSAVVGRRSGVSATGALDDALAGLQPGFIVTDNTQETLLGRFEVNPEHGVALYVPARPHPPTPSLVEAFGPERARAEGAVRAALEGDWAKAMELNTELVERVMGYPYRRLRGRLQDHGAVASGVSGVGPTLAAIAPRAKLGEVRDALPSDGAQRLVVSFAEYAAGGRSA